MVRTRIRSPRWAGHWILDGICCALAFVFFFRVQSSAAQCSTITGRFEVVWLIEASSYLLPDEDGFDPFTKITEFIGTFANSMVMNSQAVRQSFVLFSGPVDGSNEISTIGSYISLDDPEAISRSAFQNALKSATVLGGSTDVAGGLDFVRTTILDPAKRRPSSTSLVFLLTVGYPSNSSGEITNQAIPEEAAQKLVQETGAELVLIRFDGPENYPPNYLRNQVTSIFDTTLLTMSQDLVMNGNLCPLFVVDSVLPSIGVNCQNLTLNDEAQVVGEVCVGVKQSAFLLEYRVKDGWVLTESNSWIGANPTTIPYAKGGVPLPGRFPFSSNVVSIPVTSLDFGSSCDVYVLPRALLATTVDGDDGELVPAEGGMEAFAGEVFFHQAGGSKAKLFRSNIPNCETFTSAPSRAPTYHPIPVRPGFDFDFVFTTEGATPTQQLAFKRSAARVSSIFTKDYATQTCLDAGTTICSYTLPTRTCIDDMLVLVSFKPLDGPDEIIAQSGPCVIANELEQVRVGVLTFDSDDFETILDDGRFNSTLQHHLMHILGFGTRWQFWGLTSTTDDSITYLGSNGQEGYTQVGGAVGTSPEVEYDGFHWKQTVFGNELMTLNETALIRPLSKLSVMSLKDLGFNVDENKADPYTIPTERRRLQESSRSNSKRQLQQSQVSDVLVLPLIGVGWTVKPGREADLEAELAFVAAHMRTLSPTSATSPSETSSNETGIIVGSVVAVIFVVCLLFVATVGIRRGKKRSSKQPKPKAEAEPRSLPTKLESPRGNWKEQTDVDGRTFWINEDTGEFSWSPPEAFTRPPPDPSEHPAPPPPRPSSLPRKVTTAMGDTWTEMNDDTGNTYWMNEESGEFSWVAPSGKSFASAASGNASSRAYSPIQRINSTSYGSPVGQPQEELVVSTEPDSPRMTVTFTEEPVEEFIDIVHEEEVDHGADAASGDYQDTSYSYLRTDNDNDIEAQDSQLVASSTNEEDYDMHDQSLPNYSARSQWN